MDCENAHRVPLAAGGDLPPDELKSCLAHVKDCPACREIYLSHQRQIGMLRSVARTAPPAGILHSLTDRVLREAGRSARPRTASTRRLDFLFPAVAAAALLLLALVYGTGHLDPARAPMPEPPPIVLAFDITPQPLLVLDAAGAEPPIFPLQGVSPSQEEVGLISQGTPALPPEEDAEASRYLLAEYETLDDAQVSLDF